VHTQEVTIEGKWFNYGVVFIVMVFDLYQWKNQIYYQPWLYGQYTDSQGSKQRADFMQYKNKKFPHTIICNLSDLTGLINNLRPNIFFKSSIY